MSDPLQPGDKVEYVWNLNQEEARAIWPAGPEYKAIGTVANIRLSPWSCNACGNSEVVLDIAEYPFPPIFEEGSGFCPCGWRKIFRPGDWIARNLKMPAPVRKGHASGRVPHMEPNS